MPTLEAIRLEMLEAIRLEMLIGDHQLPHSRGCRNQPCEEKVHARAVSRVPEEVEVEDEVDEADKEWEYHLKK